MQSVCAKLMEIKELPCNGITRSTVENKRIVTIPADSDVFAAYKILSSNQISSAPVVDTETGAICGMLDYVDLADMFIHQQVDFNLRETARSIADRSMKDPFYSTGAKSPISGILEVFGSGVHRIVLMDDEIPRDGRILCPAERIYGIVSQSDVLRWLYDNKREVLKPLTLSSAISITYPAVSINVNETLLAAIRKMRLHAISSIAVVETQHAIIANLSVSDLEYLISSKTSHDLLHQPVLKFVSLLLSEAGIRDGRDRYPYYDVYEDTPLLSVIEKLLATKTHRVWVVEKPAFSSADELKRLHPTLLGVVSMTDIIRSLFKTENASKEIDG